MTTITKNMRTAFNNRVEGLIGEFGSQIRNGTKKICGYALPDGRELAIQRDDSTEINIWTEPFGNGVALFADEKIEYLPSDSRSSNLKRNAPSLSEGRAAYMFKFKLKRNGEVIDEEQVFGRVRALLHEYARAAGRGSQDERWSPTSQPSKRAAQLSPEEFLRIQDRKSEIGLAGELIALKNEIERLRDHCRCHNPEEYVRQISLEDIGRGYDLESTWPGHERFIEVKTSTQNPNHFYLSLNELQTLTRYAERAWIYTVKLEESGSGAVVSQIQNPARSIPGDAFTSVVWRVKLPRELC